MNIQTNLFYFHNQNYIPSCSSHVDKNLNPNLTKITQPILMSLQNNFYEEQISISKGLEKQLLQGEESFVNNRSKTEPSIGYEDFDSFLRDEEDFVNNRSQTESNGGYEDCDSVFKDEEDFVNNRSQMESNDGYEDLDSSEENSECLLSQTSLNQPKKMQKESRSSLYQKLWLEAEQSQCHHLLPLNLQNKSFLLFAPNGNAYSIQGVLGEGKFKTVYAVKEVAMNQRFSSISSPRKAVSLSKNPLNKQEKNIQDCFVNTILQDNSITNETKILAYLKDRSQYEDLSNVNLSEEDFRFYYRTDYLERAEDEKAENLMQNDNPLLQIYEGSFTELFHGDVNDLIGSRSFITLNENKRLTIIRDIARGIAQLHKVGVVHRDIKPDNCLYIMNDSIDDNIKVKITDFGHSSLIDGRNRHAMRFPYTLYMDPSWHEVQGWKNTFSPASDVYQLGLTAFQILVNYSISDLTKLHNDFALEKDFTEVPSHIHNAKHASYLAWKQQPETWKALEDNIEDDEVKHMILSMLSLSQDARPSADQVAKFFERKLAELEDKGSIYRETSLFNEDL